MQEDQYEIQDLCQSCLFKKGSCLGSLTNMMQTQLIISEHGLSEIITNCFCFIESKESKENEA